MTTFHITKNRTAVYDITGQDDTYILDKGVRVVVTGNALSEAAGFSGNTIEIRGYLEGDYAFYSEGVDTTLLVATSGKIRGEDGIALSDGATFVNRGDVRIEDQGIEAGMDSRIENFGTITSNYCIDIESGLIINHAGATIVGNEYALVPNNTSGSSVKFVNDGTLQSPKFAYVGGDGIDWIVNRGTMTGSVLLDAGDDIFDNLKGDYDDGTLIGGTGDDILLTASKSLRMIEIFGEGIDTVKSTSSYVLNANVENLYLLGQKNISATGNDGINLLVGNKGNNTLSGNAGNDFLDGKAGNDKLIGGLAEEDNFTFSTGYGRDTIVDFEDNVDNINIESLAAVTSFADLLANQTRDTDKGLLIFAGNDQLLIRNMTEASLDLNDVFI
jgi:Ca2+-binding RTX toxin-like protein